MSDSYGEQIALQNEHLALNNERWRDPLVRCAVCGRLGEPVTLVGGYRTTLCHEDGNQFQLDTRYASLFIEYHQLTVELVLLRIAHAREDVREAYLPKWAIRQRLERDLFNYCRQWVESHRR